MCNVPMKILHSAKQMQLGFDSERLGLSEMIDLPISTVTVSRNLSIYIEFIQQGTHAKGCVSLVGYTLSIAR